MADSGSDKPLTPREEEMRQLLLAGDYSGAAKRFYVSEKTIRAQAPYLLEKWERRLATNGGAGPAPLGPTNETRPEIETPRADEEGPPRTLLTGRRIPGKGKPRPHKRSSPE